MHVKSAPLVSACEQRSWQLSLSAQGEEYDLDKHSFLRWSFSARASPLELLCYNNKLLYGERAKKDAQIVLVMENFEN